MLFHAREQIFVQEYERRPFRLLRTLTRLVMLYAVAATEQIRWTGATGSEFRIKRDPAKLLGSAVARSTQPFGTYQLGARSEGTYS